MANAAEMPNAAHTADSGVEVDGVSTDEVAIRETRALQDRRVQMRRDRANMEHFVQAAHMTAVEQQWQAHQAEQAMNQQFHAQLSLQQQFIAAKADLSSAQSALHGKRVEVWRLESALRALRANTTRELSQLAAALAAEEQHRDQVVGKAQDMSIACRCARTDAAAQMLVTRDAAGRAGAEERELEKTRTEAIAVDEMAAMTVKQALDELQQDFAKERALLQARDRTSQAKVLELEKMLDFGADPGGRAVASSAMPPSHSSPTEPSSPPRSPLGASGVGRPFGATAVMLENLGYNTSGAFGIFRRPGLEPRPLHFASPSRSLSPLRATTPQRPACLLPEQSPVARSFARVQPLPTTAMSPAARTEASVTKALSPSQSLLLGPIVTPAPTAMSMAAAAMSACPPATVSMLGCSRAAPSNAQFHVRVL